MNKLMSMVVKLRKDLKQSKKNFIKTASMKVAAKVAAIRDKIIRS